MEIKKCPQCGHNGGIACKTIIESFGKDRGNLIPMLHAIQQNMGYLTAEAMEEAATWLSVPVSEVYGTATFYTLFATAPKGKNVVRLCDSPPCHIEGAELIKRALQATLGISEGETSEDGSFTFEPVRCIGLCGVAPAMMINNEVYGNLTPEMIPGIIGKYREEA
ncbi:MAG TPA: NADH-quinone oxidoreductase subunit NuoE [Armatimonadota bacterium]